MRSSSALRLPAATGLRLVRAEKARRSLHEFVRQAWPVVEPATPFIDTWHVGAICDHLEAVTRGEITRLLINVPPGHAKSLLVAVLWPAWVWSFRPAWRGLFASYAYDLAERDSVRCRALIRSDWYRVFMEGGGWGIVEDQDTKGYFVNTASGFRFSTSVEAQATGWRGDAVVVDDPVSAKEAPSEAKRREAIHWWDLVMSSRLNDMERGARVIIMQRLHEDDLAGHVLVQGGYEHLCLPSEFEPARRAVTCRTVGGVRSEFWRDPRTTDGELLFPKLFPATVLEQARKDLGSGGYAGQHGQRPTPEGGGMFKKGWWRFWKPDGIAPDHCPRPNGCWEGPARALPKLDRVVLSLDAAFKATDSTDFVVFQIWGTSAADRFLLAQVRGRMSFTDTLSTFRRLAREWPQARQKLVEDKANGPAIINTLKHEISGIIAVNPEGGKEARAAAVQPQVESGNVYLPDSVPWLDGFVEEFAAFPRGRHDDQVDALTQALNHMANRSDGVFDYYRQAALGRSAT